MIFKPFCDFSSTRTSGQDTELVKSRLETTGSFSSHKGNRAVESLPGDVMDARSLVISAENGETLGEINRVGD